MKEVTIQEVVAKAKKLHSEGKRWHFHLLMPDCVFNQRKDKHAFVLEDRSNNKTFVVYSDNRYLKEGEMLVKLLYGDTILKKSDAESPIQNKDIIPILKREEELNKKGIMWHHHLLFPDCIFNKHKGKWNIIFEDPERGSVSEVLYDEEPVDDLRRVEIFYYQQKE